MSKQVRKGQIGLLYLITNRVNRKLYIGKTVCSLKRRWTQHISSAKKQSQYALHRAINKYGAENFDKCVLLIGSQDYLIQMEQAAIERFDSRRNGYNMTVGGEGVSRPCSPETREKLRQINLGKRHTEETKKKMSEAHKGRPAPFLSPETRERIRQKLLGRKMSPEIVEKMSKARKGIATRGSGWKQTEEWKAKIKAINIGNQYSRKSHCKNGHPLDGPTAYHSTQTRNGRTWKVRRCNICHAARARVYKASLGRAA